MRSGSEWEGFLSNIHPVQLYFVEALILVGFNDINVGRRVCAYQLAHCREGPLLGSSLHGFAMCGVTEDWFPVGVGNPLTAIVDGANFERHVVLVVFNN